MPCAGAYAPAAVGQKVRRPFFTRTKVWCMAQQSLTASISAGHSGLSDNQPTTPIKGTRAITAAKLDAAVRSGAGHGRGDNYKPWIRIRRKLSSPYSNLHSTHVPNYTRSLQLLSGLEFAAANVAVWLGATEIREQHPAWPQPHEHPAGGYHPEIDQSLGEVPGLLGIARKAGIDHGVYPGTKIPFVATIDFTLGVGAWHENRLVHWSCKPRELLDSAPNRARMHERITLERLYSTAVGAHHAVIDGTQFSKRLIENLDWLRPVRSELVELTAGAMLKDFASTFMEFADHESIHRSKCKAAELFGLEPRVADSHFRTAAWLGLIDIDLSAPILMSRQLTRDGGRTRAGLTDLLWGSA